MKQTLFSNREISDFCRSLALLLHAGISTGDGLTLLAEEEPSGPQKEFLNSLAAKADKGLSLSVILRESGRFPAYVCSLLDVGRETGRTEDALHALALYYDDRERLSQRLRTALLYPSLLLLVMLAVIVILLTKVLPVFDEVYASLGSDLTGIAGGLLRLGESLSAVMPLLSVLLALAILFLILFSLLPGFRGALIAFWQKHRGDKGISYKINTARFAQALSMSLSSGLPLEDALTLSASLLTEADPLNGRLQTCLQRMEAGETLTRALSASGLLPHAECRLLELSLRSGSGDSAMTAIAERLSEESDLALERKLGQVEPAMVLVTSILVGLILLAVMLPLMNITAAMG
ncbi:MAG: type II secretion system F family protein [Clostridiales bacterium]|nr:type II secretion system F family protein [Clostridiales bacterium]